MSHVATSSVVTHVFKPMPPQCRLREWRQGRATPLITSAPQRVMHSIPSAPRPCEDSPADSLLDMSTPMSETLEVLTPIYKSLPMPLRAPRSPVFSTGSASPDGESECSAHDHDLSCTPGSLTVFPPHGEAAPVAVVEAKRSRAHAFWLLMCATLGPAHTAPYLWLQDVLELSLTCRAAMRGYLLSPVLWQHLSCDRFGVHVQNTQSCFNSLLRQYSDPAPPTYDSSSTLRDENVADAALRCGRAGEVAGRLYARVGDGTADAGVELTTTARMLGAGITLSSPAETTDALRHGTLVRAASHVPGMSSCHVPPPPHPLHRLTLREETDTHLSHQKSRAWRSNDTEAETRHTGLQDVYDWQALSTAAGPVITTVTHTAVSGVVSGLFWRHLFQWLHQHRVSQFLVEHVDRHVCASESTPREAAAPCRTGLLSLTRAIHALCQGGCAQAEHAARLASLLQTRAALQPAASAALSDLSVAAVLCPDDEAGIHGRLAALIHEGDTAVGAIVSGRDASSGIVEAWVRGYDAASAARNAHDPFVLFAFLQTSILTLETTASSTTTSANTTACARLSIIASVLLFLHTFEELHVAPVHVLVKATAALRRCGALSRPLEQLLLESLGHWCHPTEPNSDADVTVLAGHVELAMHIISIDAQRAVEARCERWVSEWILRRHVTLPAMLSALHTLPHERPERATEDGERDDALLTDILLSLHHRVLLLPRRTEGSCPSPSGRTLHCHRARARPAEAANTTPHTCSVSAWESVVRFLVLTPFRREKAAALTCMAALYHHPLQAHAEQCTHLVSRGGGQAGALLSRPALGADVFDDTPPLPTDTDGALVAMRLLHAACALDSTYAAAHTTLAVLCLSMGDTGAAQHGLERFLDAWMTTVSGADRHLDDDEGGQREPPRDVALSLRTAGPERLFIPALVLELRSRCEGGQAALRACKRWASEATRHHPRLSAPVRLRAATYMDRGMGQRADNELAALVRVTLRSDDVALRLGFLLDVLQQQGEQTREALQWGLVAELAGTLYGLGILEGQIEGAVRGAELTGPYAQLLHRAQRACREHNRSRCALPTQRGTGVHIGNAATPQEDEDDGRACAHSFLQTLLHGSHSE